VNKEVVWSASRLTHHRLPAARFAESSPSASFTNDEAARTLGWAELGFVQPPRGRYDGTVPLIPLTQLPLRVVRARPFGAE